MTLNTERTSGKVVAVTQEEESMDIDSCLPTDQHSSRSKKAKEKEAGEINLQTVYLQSDWPKK